MPRKRCKGGKGATTEDAAAVKLKHKDPKKAQPKGQSKAKHQSGGSASDHANSKDTSKVLFFSRQVTGAV